MAHNLRLSGPYFLRRQLGPQAARMLDMLRSSDVDLRRVAKFVSDHPPLAEALIRQANSALLATGRTVSGVNHALSVLGINRLRQFASRVASPDDLSIDRTAIGA